LSFKEVDGVLDEWIRGEKSDENGKVPWLNSQKGRLLIVIVICIGLLALLWPNSVSNDSSSTHDAPLLTERSASNSIKQSMQTELAMILAHIEGAGSVEVSVSLSSEGVKTYATNDRDERRQTEEGGQKSTVEESRTRDIAVSSGTPLLLEEKMPEILGVLVVADGAQDPQVKENLAQATRKHNPEKSFMVLTSWPATTT
jgi:stage III sporulation protein AG